MHVNFRIKDKRLIEYLERLEEKEGRGAKSRFINEALLSHLGRPPIPDDMRQDLKTLLRQITGIATNINQIAYRSNLRTATALPTIEQLLAVRDTLKTHEKPLRSMLKKWGK
ncbi:plasmid mobilization relaxosome protein MobC [Kiloniella laminariae]|uniref:Plasmid mobilization relaxosome protein MobC n=1 Tax=Kiloniella laminariae TaxID=454162 RepID=A0ABT4LPW6_9PROT|nr:plasmid mobilization relaxosome protein MobC [Kiloniella laminariae]MCZ4283136.1 plasmid mobilization relaxosome protein MobC [Kiloniella laminariae]